ncbi:dTDP-glucose 4,6-dehydratase [Desulfosarcina ovata]|uniref:dTDP-glucose 4,6-dehydratase n=2 Tax=Desulfosarcina ovata TaxID=83564 RepID=A0A5K8A5M6_9BACT|nr:dTDP-glucose 4,6-dehydratase [Desulfosarcina ovata]BBO80298.1 dTDP-glucose 4,6-dehydratase [Desulfosarcina ovata subsp. sediminis]BBO87688.1 dTDP-glucose 4,6-dehydratase [Desulfosarcina ovata subsp. ovata]
MEKQRTIIVTGGAGFIGSNFVHFWLEKTNQTVVNLDKLTYAGNLDNLKRWANHPRHIFVNGDIADRQVVSNLLKDHHPWAIVNFAAESHVDRSISAPDDFIQTNVVGTFNLLRESYAYWNALEPDAKEAFRFLHVSTDEVYGSLEKDDPAFSETTPYAPNSPYSASKASSDHLVRAYHHTYGLPTLTTNCSNNYGPYQFPEKLIPLVIHNALQRKPIPIYGDGMNVRDWLYVEDHCAAIGVVLDSGRVGQVYNIGGNNEITNRDIVNTICRILDDWLPGQKDFTHASLIEFVTDRPGHDRRYAIDASKIKNELGWDPQESFATGIARTIRWYLDNAAWVENVTSGAYQRWVKLNYEERG